MDPERPDASGTESKLRARYRRVQELRHRHPAAEIAIFFAAGVLFDIVTLSRVDDLFNLVQQAVYLVLLGGLMFLEERYAAGVAAPPRWLAGAWRYAEDAIHFLLGSLLSVFTLLYLKSTSGLSSLLFLSFLCVLLVANELPQFRAFGPVVRFALLSLCLTTYLAILLPVVAGFLSFWLFVVAVALSCGAFWWLAKRLARGTGNAGAAWWRAGVPAFAMQGLLVAAYFAGVIPPVPLSVQFIGIYHEVVPPGGAARPAAVDPAAATHAPAPLNPPATVNPPAEGVPPVEGVPPADEGAPESPEEAAPPQQAGVIGLSTSGGPVAGGQVVATPAATAPKDRPRGYQLKHLRPWWKFWQHGDQDFAARPGDVVYCFARVFAPRGFKDAVYAHWWAEGRGGWVDQGRARLDISGGRGEGFRAFATKRNYRPGRWRVTIETEDGRDLGAIRFDLTTDESTDTRDFDVDAG